MCVLGEEQLETTASHQKTVLVWTILSYSSLNTHHFLFLLLL